MSTNDFPEWLLVPRAVVAVLVFLVVTGRLFTRPTSDPLVLVSAVAVVAFFAASAVEPVRDHSLYPTATGAVVTGLFGFWAVTADDPAVPGFFAVAAGVATLAAFYYARRPSDPDEPVPPSHTGTSSSPDQTADPDDTDS